MISDLRTPQMSNVSHHLLSMKSTQRETATLMYRVKTYIQCMYVFTLYNYVHLMMPNKKV